MKYSWEFFYSQSAVIASAAKQSIARHNGQMDCFVASLLAMTGLSPAMTSVCNQVTQRPGCSSFATSVRTLTGGSQAIVFATGFAGPAGRLRA